MTAAARQPRFAQGVDERPDAEFVPIKRAARLLGKTETALRHVCGRRLASTGMARQIRDPRSGKPAWHIHRSHDPRLLARADESTDDSTAEILLHATAAQRDRAAARVRVLNAYRQLVSSDTTVGRVICDFLEEQAKTLGQRITLRTLQRWNSEAPPTDQPQRLLAFFIDRRGGDQRSSEASGRGCHPDAWAEFERVYLHRNRWSIAKAHRHVQTLAKSNGWQWPGLRHVQRRANQIIDPSRLCLARDGREIWQAKFGYKIQQDPDAWSASELWVSDHVRLDFFVRRHEAGQWKAVRPWLTSWFDWRTRKILGWWIDWTPNADTIRYALHDAIKGEGGPPRRIVIDNGKDYDSYANNGLTKQQRRRLAQGGEDWSEHAAGRGLFGMLGIDVHFALPYNHNGKSRIERWHRTLHSEFDAEFDSYCGAKPGDVELPRGFFKNVQSLVNIDEVRQRLPRFIDWYNNRDDHFIGDLADEQGRKLSPTEAMNEWRDTRTIMPRPEALALLMHRWEPPRTVGKLGIGVRIDGRTIYYGQDAIELRPLQGRKKGVQVTYDPADMSQVFVYDTQFRFISAAQANSTHGGHSPVSRAALKAALKRQRDHEKAVRDSLRDGHMSLMTAADIARDEQDKIDADRRAERAKQGIGVENDNQQLRIVRTPVDDQLPGVERAQMRQAAGAEFEEFDLADMQPSERDKPDAWGECDDFDIADFQSDDDSGEDDQFDFFEAMDGGEAS